MERHPQTDIDTNVVVISQAYFISLRKESRLKTREDDENEEKGEKRIRTG
jgi:hypothetical protein